jgi:hypothetical protein
MDTAPYLRYATSTQHMVMLVATLGLGIASASIVGIGAGLILYGAGWFFIPDWLERRRKAQEQDLVKRRRTAEEARLRLRETLGKELPPPLSERFFAFANALRQLTSGDPMAREAGEAHEEAFLQLLQATVKLEDFVVAQAAAPSVAEALRQQIAEQQASEKQADHAHLHDEALLALQDSLRLQEELANRISAARIKLQAVAANLGQMETRLRLFQADAASSRISRADIAARLARESSVNVDLSNEFI